MTAWTEEMDATLKREAAAGLSASQIAAVIGGITRNAVVGRAHRRGIKLGISRGKAAPASRAAPKPKPALKVPQTRPSRIAFATLQVAERPVEREPLPPKLPPKPKPAEIISIGITIDKLGLRTCRAPIWGNVTPPTNEALYCGAETVPGRPYCAGHRFVFVERTPGRTAPRPGGRHE